MSTTTSSIRKSSASTAPGLRLKLYRGNVYRLPVRESVVRVISGVAWVTQDGEDVVMRDGEEMRLASELVSPLGMEPLTVEVETLSRN